LTSLCPSLRFYTDTLDQNIGLYKKELIKIQEKEEKEGPIYLEKNIRRMSGGIGSGSGRFFSSTSTSTTGTTNASQERISRAHSFSIKDSIGGGRIEEKSKRE
jgi:hypothetical protein